MRIAIIRPALAFGNDESIEDQYKTFASPGTEVKALLIERGPSSIECRYDVAEASLWVAKTAIKAESQGYDACVVNCFADPGLGPARECVRIPVVSPGESGLMLASILGVNFGVIAVASELVPAVWEMIRMLTLQDKVICVDSIDVPVLQLGEEYVLNRLVEKAAHMVKHRGVHALVLGCTGMVGMASKVQANLASRGYDLPVVDPAGAALSVAELMVRLGVSHSKRSYSRLIVTA